MGENGKEPTIRGLGQISIRVQNIDRATDFYRDTLGLRYLFSAPPALAFFECGDVRLMLAEPEGGSVDIGTSILYYRVDDISAMAARLKARGVVFDEEPRVVHRTDVYELWIGSFRDSEGNVLALMKEMRK